MSDSDFTGQTVFRELVRTLTEAWAEPIRLAEPKSAQRALAAPTGRIDTETRMGTRSVFVKSMAASDAARIAAEADGLAALAETHTVRVPRVLGRVASDGREHLLLEWLDLASLSPSSAAQLGESLAALHRITQAKFGWPRDNFIGATPQQNAEREPSRAGWIEFVQHERLLFQLHLAARNSYPSRMIDRGERLVADCPALFASYSPQPSLLHGDLWGGNAGALLDGTPAVFDPAVYCGDREADLAMTELFGGFPRDFYASYNNAWPLDHGYRVRRGFYNVYHLLNHANLFAGDYVRQAERAIESVLAEL